LRGFQRALSEANIELPLGSIQESRFDPRSGYAAAMRLLQRLPRPTAIFASDDLLASGCLAAVQHSGLRCPEDISVVGFDNLEFFEHTAPPLTTVHQSGYQVGETACRNLLKRIENPELPAQRVVLPTELRVRNSTGPAERSSRSSRTRKS
jgi:LacI family transcriptional regulator